MIINSTSTKTTKLIGYNIGKQLQKGDIIALEGGLAAGKTTLTKGIAHGLEIKEDITSPTFTLISEYKAKLPLYHMDMYRLDGIEDFINLGAEELIYGDGVSIIEWSEKIIDELPKETITIKIEVLEDNSRNFIFKNWKYKKIKI